MSAAEVWAVAAILLGICLTVVLCACDEYAADIRELQRDVADLLAANKECRPCDCIGCVVDVDAPCVRCSNRLADDWCWCWCGRCVL